MNTHPEQPPITIDPNVVRRDRLLSAIFLTRTYFDAAGQNALQNPYWTQNLAPNVLILCLRDSFSAEAVEQAPLTPIDETCRLATCLLAFKIERHTWPGVGGYVIQKSGINEQLVAKALANSQEPPHGFDLKTVSPEAVDLALEPVMTSLQLQLQEAGYDPTNHRTFIDLSDQPLDSF